MAENMNVAAVTTPVKQTADKPTVKTPDTKSQEPAQIVKASAQQAEVSVKELEAAIAQLNEFMKQGQRSLSFSIDDSIDEVVIRVVDTETQELVRQIPNEEALRFKRHLDGVLGILFNDKA